MKLTEDYTKEISFIKARKQVDSLKGYYRHVLIYLVVNIFVSINKIVDHLSNGDSMFDAIFDYSTFALWLVWGIGLAIHSIRIFGPDVFFNKNWEERKIRDYMNK